MSFYSRTRRKIIKPSGSEDEQRSIFKKVALSPVSGFAASVSLLVSGLLISYLIGRVGLEGLLAAAILVVVLAVLAVSLALVVTSQWAASRESSTLSGLTTELREVSQELALISEVLVSTIGATAISSSRASLLSDGQYALIEGSRDVAQVVIAVQQMAVEFEDELANRDALVDFQSVVMSNLRRGVRYVYITERTNINVTRAHRVAWKTLDLSRLIKVVLVPSDRWEMLPFSVDTVFLRMKGGQLDSYMLLPNGANKAERTWVRMSPDYRDQWWAIAEEFLEEAESLSATEIPPAE